MSTRKRRQIYKPPKNSRKWNNSPADFYIFLQKAFEAEAQALVPQMAPLDSQEATELISKARPLLSWDNLPLEWPLVQKWLTEVLLTFARCFPALAKHAEDLLPVSSNLKKVREAAKAVYLGCSIPRSVIGSKIERELLRQAAYVVLRLFLCAQREAFLPLVSQELWMRGTCPLCGGLPDIAFYNQEQKTRWLVCCRCDARWLFKWTGCPYCDCTDKASLSYFSPERENCRNNFCMECPYCYCTEQDCSSSSNSENGGCRLHFCSECHHYLRTVDLKHREGELPLYLLRWQTFKLDKQAYKEGYRGTTGISRLHYLTNRSIKSRK